MSNARSAAADFAAWAAGREGLEPDVVETLVQFKAEYLGDRSDVGWTREHLRSLLLEWLPGKVTADGEWIAATVPTMRSYVRFLRDTGRLHRGADAAGTLLAELDALEREYPDAMRDRSRFGIAKSLVTAHALDHLSQDEEPVSPELAGLDVDGPPESVPAVRLPSSAVLAEMARSSPLLDDVARLAAWIGTRKHLTQTGALRLGDAWAAVEELGLLEKETSENVRARVRSARDIRALQMLWAVAVASGFVTLSRTTASEGPALQLWRDGDDDEVLEAWRRAFEVVTDLGIDYGLERRYQPPLFEQVEEAVLGACPGLYVGARTSVDELIAELAESLGVAGAQFGEPLKSWVDREVRDFVGRLAEVGALGDEGGEVTMTPLGRWVVREQLLEVGTDAPVVGDVRGMDAGQMLAQVCRLPAEESERARREWLDCRSPDQAARDLARVGCEGRALERVAVLTILASDLGSVAAAVLAEVADDERFGPHARTWLAEHAGGHVDDWLSEVQKRRLAVDGVAALLQALPPGYSVRDVPEEVWQFAETCLPAAGDAPIGDAEAIQVYEAIGAAHPKGRVRKAAKKAAHQARQLQGAPAGRGPAWTGRPGAGVAAAGDRGVTKGEAAPVAAESS